MFFRAVHTSNIAEICGTPIPAIILVVQIEPGPIPTFTASAPALTNSIAASAVAILPPITSTLGNFCLTALMVSITFLEWPCALSITKTSTPSLNNASALSKVSLSVPKAAPTINLPKSSLVASGFLAVFSMSLIVTRPDNLSSSSRTRTFSILFLYINCITSV